MAMEEQPSVLKAEANFATLREELYMTNSQVRVSSHKHGINTQPLVALLCGNLSNGCSYLQGAS